MKPSKMRSTESQMSNVYQSNMGGIAVPATKPGEEPIAFVQVKPISTAQNISLRFGEWFGITTFGVLALATAIEIGLIGLATFWFHEPNRALMPFGALVVILFVAALVMRLPESISLLQPIEPVLFLVGYLITALLAVKVLVFSTVAADDLSWLAAFGGLINYADEQPHAILGILFVVGALWYYGLQFARNAGDYERIRAFYFRFLVLLVIAIALGEWSDHASTTFPDAVIFLLPLYIVTGLFMLSQVRLAEVRHRVSRTNGNTTVRTRRMWQLTSLGMSLASVSLLLVLAAVLYRDAYQRALEFLTNAWGMVVNVVFAVFAWLFIPILALIIPPSSTPDSPNQPQPRSLCQFVSGQDDGSNCQVDAASQQTLHQIYAVSLIVVVIVFLIAALIIVRRALKSKAEEDDFEEIRESIGVRGRMTEPAIQMADAANTAIDMPPPGSVRAIYRTFLHRSAEAGLAREPGETPAEFEGRATQQFTQVAGDEGYQADFDDLTHAYEDERYGGAASTPSLIARVRSAARHIESAIGQVMRLGRDRGK